jgi:hypothetical protein
MQRAQIADARAAFDPAAGQEADRLRQQARSLPTQQQMFVPGQGVMTNPAFVSGKAAVAGAEETARQQAQFGPASIAGKGAIASAEATGKEAGAVHNVQDEDGNIIPITGQKYMEIAQANSQGQPAMVNGKQVFATDSPQAKAMTQNYEQYTKDDRTFNTNYAKNREMLTSLAPIYQAWKSGRGGEQVADLTGWANRFGIAGVLPQGWQNSTAGFDSAIKVATMQAFGVLQDTPGLQRAPRTGLQETLLTSARPEADPTAAWNIITHGLASLDYAHDMYGDVDKHMQGINVDKQVNNFADQANFNSYLANARKEIPLFKGMTPDNYHSVTGAALERNKNGEIRDKAAGHRWDANGNPVQ